MAPSFTKPGVTWIGLLQTIPRRSGSIPSMRMPSATGLLRTTSSAIQIADCPLPGSHPPRASGAATFGERAAIYYVKRDLDPAIADFPTPSRLDPQYANAFRSRATAHNLSSNPIARFGRHGSHPPRASDAATFVPALQLRQARSRPRNCGLVRSVPVSIPRHTSSTTQALVQYKRRPTAPSPT